MAKVKLTYAKKKGAPWSYFVRINDAVFVFALWDLALEFYNKINEPPPGTTNYQFDIHHTRLNDPLDLNYRTMRYEFFTSNKLRREILRVVYESVLSDGRASVIYVKPPYIKAHQPGEFYLVIGRIVILGYSIENLVKLNAAIDDGSGTSWRP